MDQRSPKTCLLKICLYQSVYHQKFMKLFTKLNQVFCLEFWLKPEVSLSFWKYCAQKSPCNNDFLCHFRFIKKCRKIYIELNKITCTMFWTMAGRSQSEFVNNATVGGAVLVFFSRLFIVLLYIGC